MAKQKKKEKAEEQKQGKNQKGKNKKKGENKGGYGQLTKPRQPTTPRRDRTDSAYDLPSGMDNVSVSVEEIMSKYYGKLHPQVINLGLQLVSEKLNGASLRCLGILKAIIKFVKDYEIGKISISNIHR